jgi:hypothetical protein
MQVGITICTCKTSIGGRSDGKRYVKKHGLVGALPALSPRRARVSSSFRPSSDPFEPSARHGSEAAAPPSAKWSWPCGADELRASRFRLSMTTKILAAASRRDARLPVAPTRRSPLVPSDPADIAWRFARVECERALPWCPFQYRSATFGDVLHRGIL